MEISNDFCQDFSSVNKKFREKFIEDHGFLRCEHCGLSNCGVFHTHHIVFRSELGKKKDIHNFKNLILLCPRCHELFHTDKSVRNRYVKSRFLNELYDRNFIIQNINN